MWLLGSGKQSILLTRMEWKEVAQSRGSAWRVPVPPPPMLTHTPREGRRSGPRRLIGAAGSPLLTLRLLEPPGEIFDAHVLELEQVLQASHLHLQDLGEAPQRSSPEACCPRPCLSRPQSPSAFPVRPHLHSLLRGQQLLLLFSNLEDEASVALQRLAIPQRPGHRQPAHPGVRSSLAQAWILGPTLTLPVSLDQAFFPRHGPPPVPDFPTFPGATLTLTS